MTTKTKKAAKRGVATEVERLKEEVELVDSARQALQKTIDSLRVELADSQRVCAELREALAFASIADKRGRALAGTLAAMVRRAAREVTPVLAAGLLQDLERELRDAGVVGE